MNKKLAEVVQSVELASLQYEGRDRERKQSFEAVRQYLVDQWPQREPSES